MAAAFRIELVDTTPAGKPAPAPPAPAGGPAALNAAQIRDLNRQFPGMAAEIQKLAGLTPAGTPAPTGGAGVPPSPSSAGGGSAANYWGVVKDYLIGSARAQLHPLARMLVDESGVFKAGGGRGAGGYHGAGQPQPVFVTNWPENIGAPGSSAPSAAPAANAPDESAVDTLKGSEES